MGKDNKDKEQKQPAMRPPVQPQLPRNAVPNGIQIEMDEGDTAYMDSLSNDIIQQNQRAQQSQELVTRATNEYNQSIGALQLLDKMSKKAFEAYKKKYSVPDGKNFTYEPRLKKLIEIR